MMDKPHKGRIINYTLLAANNKFAFSGVALDHPEFKGRNIITSYVVKYDRESGEIETLNSLYTLVENEE